MLHRALKVIVRQEPAVAENYFDPESAGCTSRAGSDLLSAEAGTLHVHP
jgi:hypothetical protein